MCMLQGDVNVFADFWLACNHLNQRICKILRIGVKRANPLNPLDFHEFFEKLRELWFSICQISSILGRILRNQNNLLHTMHGKVLNLRFDVRDRPAAVFAANLWNRAESTAIVAALRNLHICGIARRRHNARRILIVKRFVLTRKNNTLPFQRCFDRLHDAAPCARADDGICFRQFIKKILPIALPQTARNDETAAATCFLIIRHVENRRDGFFLCRLNEGTGIYNEDIRILRARRNLDAMLLQDAEHDLGID